MSVGGDINIQIGKVDTDETQLLDFCFDSLIIFLSIDCTTIIYNDACLKRSVT